MHLLSPKTYRFKPAQEAWLQARADKQGHGQRVVVLRMLIEREMKKNGKPSPHGKQRA